MSVFTSEPPVWNEDLPLPTPKTPSIEDEQGDCVVNERTLLPSSFEVFAGKVVSVARACNNPCPSSRPLADRLAQLKLESEKLLQDLSEVEVGEGEKEVLGKLVEEAERVNEGLSTASVEGRVGLSSLVSKALSHDETGAEVGDGLRDMILTQLNALVTTLNSPASHYNNNDSEIVDRLDRLEGLVGEWDEGKISRLRVMMGEIRDEVEVVERKMAGKNSGEGDGGGEDGVVVKRLFDRVNELEGISAALPSIVARLQSLSSLQSSSETVITKVSALEAFMSEAEDLVTSVERDLKSIENGWKNNLAGIEENFRGLEDRLAKLESK